MQDDELLFRRRLEELAERSAANYQFLFTDFLTPSEQNIFLSMGRMTAGAVLYGGFPEAERRMVRFGNPEEFGYEEDFPVRILKIAPKLEKFSDDFTHRDFLGAILNLGIDRKVTGDILLEGKAAYLMCLESIADYICENLEQVKHTKVTVQPVEEVPASLRPKRIHEEHQIASERLDALLSKVFNLSRSKGQSLFGEKKVAVNGKVEENPSFLPKEGDLISARGYGKFRYLGVDRTTKKGKLSVSIEKFV